MTSDETGSGGGWLGRALVVVIVWGVLAAAGYYAFMLFTGGGKGNRDNGPDGRAANNPSPAPRPADAAPSPAGTIELGIAYGTEKQRWLEWAVDEFVKTDAGRAIRVKLYPMGSLEGARAVVDGDEKIHVWCPASSLYRGTFVQEWQMRHSNDPIAKEETLALTPMVIVMWKDRYEAFLSKYQEVSYKTISQAIEAPGGWGDIAQKPDWGLFKFSHTDPNTSNSGLASLTLMAYDFLGKTRGLTTADVVKPEFQTWLGRTERNVVGKGSSNRLSDSTAKLMNAMVQYGPSMYDAVLVYESVAIDYLPNAEGRWGELHVVYPKINLWSENPYYILAADWVKPAHREAAEAFLKFLMSEAAQKQALVHGFRPGNTTVPVKFPESPFVQYEKFGLSIPLSSICEPPASATIHTLQQSWQRAAGP